MKALAGLCIIWFFASSFCQTIYPENFSTDEANKIKTWLRIFGISDTNTTRVSIHRKNDKLAEIMKQYRADSAFACKRLSPCWPSNLSFFLDTIAQYQNKTLHGIWIHFSGDSTCYVKGFYKNGLKDSVWVWKKHQSTETVSYKNGLYEGYYLIYAKNGTLTGKTKYARDIPIDTAYTWGDSGNIREKEFFKDGKSIWHKCFNNEGKESECLDED